ncbi:MAG: hydrolase [Phycisphaerales bacterium JB063]
MVFPEPTVDEQALRWLETQSGVMLDRLVDWASVNSGSANLAGLATMLGKVEQSAATLGGTMERADLPGYETIDDAGEPTLSTFGQALHITKHPQAERRVFLCIHMDTVFAVDHPFQSVRHDGNMLFGPGVADAKGGLVVMLAAVEALERSTLAGRVGWDILINPDEEVGSHGSDGLITGLASRCDLALLYEPALPDGTLVGARKGSGNFAIVVRGRAAHAGRDFSAGRNAVAAAAQLVTRLDAVNDAEAGDGLTLNIGRIAGGGPVNIVPDTAVVRYNVRYETAAQRGRVEQAVEQAVADINAHEGFSARPVGAFTAPPKPVGPGSEALQGLVEGSAAKLGLPAVNWRSTGGVCDGNRTAALGVPTIDTMGVRGGAIHSDQEFMQVDSLVERAKLSAHLLMTLASGAVDWPVRDTPTG